MNDLFVHGYESAGKELYNDCKYADAIELLKKAEVEGSISAHVIHGDCLYDTTQFESAFAEYEIAAKSGDINAMERLVNMVDKTQNDVTIWAQELKKRRQTILEKAAIEEIFRDNEEYKNHILNHMEVISKLDIIELIGGAPISLQQKYKLFTDLAKTESEEDKAAYKQVISCDFPDEDEKFNEILLDASLSYSAQADAVKRAIDELNLKSNETFMLQFCCIENNELQVYGSQVAGSLSQAIEAIKYEYDVEDEWEVIETSKEGLSWVTLTKYIKEGDRQIESYEYTLLGFTPVWFSINDEYLDKESRINKRRQHSFLDHAFHLFPTPSVPCPYKPGTILEIDARPFAPIRHCLVLENDDEQMWDCCSPWVMYVNGKNFESGALNHAAGIRHINSLTPSPIYNIKALFKTLPEVDNRLVNIDEEKLNWIRNIINDKTSVAKYASKLLDHNGNSVDMKDFIHTLQHCSGKYSDEEIAKIHCTMCGKSFNRDDFNENFVFDHYYGYGSKHDEEHITLRLCCDCHDKIMDFILPQCKENPIVEDDYTNRLFHHMKNLE